MNDTSTTVAVVLYKHKVLKNGEHPLMLRITKNRKASYKALGLSCNPKYWDFEQHKPKRNHPNRDLLESVLLRKVSEYREIANDLKATDREFTSASLIDKVEQQIRKVTVYSFFNEVIERLVTSNQIGNANTYRDCFRSIKAFTNSKDFTFFEVDYTFLARYETYLRAKGRADTTLSVYFRTFRALYNRAIKEKAARLQDYPFKTFEVSKFDTSTRKRAITKADIKAIEAASLPDSMFMHLARQCFLFSFYGSGINFIDIANLKWQDINNGRLLYNRSKTGKELNFKLLEPARQILEYYRPLTGTSPANYIFPILNRAKHKTPTQIDNRVHKIITRVNKELKQIAALANIDTPLTTYVARHTFATVLKKGGTATAVISEMMGHQTEAVTQTYLKSFENEILDTAAECLL